MTTDSTIIRRSLQEPSAFAELFERHSAAIGRFAAQRVGAQAAGDVLSETFLIAFRKRGSFDAAWDSALPWLFGIATRVIHRQRGQEARQWRAIAASATVAEPHTGGVAGSATERVEERADAEAAVRGLAARIERLPARDRETLLLHAWGDLTYEQIAVALQVPVGTVRSRLNRVRRKLAGAGPDRGGTAATGRETGRGAGREEESNGRAVEQGA